jgi:outer membrane protein TolC
MISGCMLHPGNINARNPVLDQYIREGIRSNLGLKQKKLDYAANLSALREARGLFFPDVAVQARYTVARGGRVISLPVGDLLNPVYSTLNLLTASDLFPQIENQEFRFYRPREHETKVSVMQPIFNAELIHNYRIRRKQAEIAEIDINRYRRELVEEITRAYYDHQRAFNLVRLADTTYLLVRENLRVSRRLFENDKVTIDAVYRSESELSNVEAEQARANNLLKASQAYFNFLLNRSLDESIELVEEIPVPVSRSLEEARELALENREELAQMEQYRQLNQHMVALHRGKNLPGLFGSFDYGFQGEEYSFTGEDDFLLASLVLRWELFQGTVNRQKVQQAKIEAEKLEELQAETRQQIILEVIHQYYALQAAYESVLSAQKQVRSATRAYELIRRKYAEGTSPLLELIDARTSMTTASANLIIARSGYFSRRAEFESATGILRIQEDT